jgi:tetratricopeptide (TPR) repeat protein
MSQSESRRSTGRSGQKESLSTLGDALRQQDPQLARRFEIFQELAEPSTRLVQITHDLLPYNWEDPELFEKGIEVTSQGRYSEAIAIFQQVLDAQPEAYPALHMLGHVFGCLQNCRNEAESYRKIIKAGGNYPQVYLSLGLAYWEQGKDKKALEAFINAIPLATEFAVVDYWFTFSIDRLHRFAHDRKKGKKEIVNRDRLFADVCYLTGLAYIEYGLHASARQAFKKAVGVDPRFADAYYELGLLHIKKLRNPKRSAKYLEQAESLYVEQNDLHRAALAQHLRKPKDTGRKETNAEAWMKEGLRLQKRGQHQSAIDAYRTAVNLQPEFADAHYNLGIAYGCQVDEGFAVHHKAIWEFEYVIQLKPDFIHAYIALGAAFIKKEEFESAIRVLEMGMNVDATDSNLYYYLGIAHKSCGQLMASVDALKRAVELKPQSIPKRFYLGVVLAEVENFHEACEMFLETVRLKPDFADGHYLLGNIFSNAIKDQEKAFFHLKKAEKLFFKQEDFSRSEQIRERLAELDG